MAISAKTDTAMNTTSNGINTGSSQASQAESPTAASTTTSAGVKQQIAVTRVPTIPNRSKCFFVMNHAIVCMLALLAVAGCATPSRKHTPDDPDNITVHCNKSTLRWNACYEAAADLCGEKGYQIVSDASGEMPEVSVNSYEVPVIGESMVIRCNQ
jgi:hypothetical protein